MASFTLDSSRLEGLEEDFAESVTEDRGRFIELQWSQGGAAQDMELYGFAVRYLPAETMTLAAPADSFVSADYAYVDSPMEDLGRAIQLQWELGGTNQDIEVLGFALRFSVAEGHAMEAS